VSNVSQLIAMFNVSNQGGWNVQVVQYAWD
jgi:hypothetical protein